DSWRWDVERWVEDASSSSHNVPAASKVRESELESHVHASDLHQNCGRASLKSALTDPDRSVTEVLLMRAIVVERFGGPEGLELKEVPRPEPGPGELLVRVMAAGTNPVDAKLRQ